METFETEFGSNAATNGSTVSSNGSTVDVTLQNGVKRTLSTTGGFSAGAKYATEDEAMTAEREDIARLQRQEQHYSQLWATGTNSRQTLFLLLNEPESSIFATIVSTFILLLIIIGSITFVAETHPDVRDDNDLMVMIHNIETACIAVFTVEYVLRVATCSERPRENRSVLKYMRNPMCIIDLLSILPFYVEQILKATGSEGDIGALAVIRILRMSRVFRVLKFGTYADDLQLFAEGFRRSGEGLAVLTFLLALYLCVGGSILYMLEYDAQREDDRSGFESIPAAWYFIIASMTTVGYGDQYPITNSGRVVCSICMLCGIFVLGLPIVIIGHSFDEVFAMEEKIKAAREEAAERKASFNRPPNYKSPRAQLDFVSDDKTQAMDNPLADTSASRAPSTADNIVGTAEINFASEGFDADAARLSFVEVLDDMYEQTGDERYHDALKELLKEGAINLYEAS